MDSCSRQVQSVFISRFSSAIKFFPSRCTGLIRPYDALLLQFPMHSKCIRIRYIWVIACIGHKKHDLFDRNRIIFTIPFLLIPLSIRAAKWNDAISIHRSVPSLFFDGHKNTVRLHLSSVHWSASHCYLKHLLLHRFDDAPSETQRSALRIYGSFSVASFLVTSHVRIQSLPFSCTHWLRHRTK